MPEAGSAPEGRAACIVIQLTKGNLNNNNNHLYLRKHLDFFPADAIGAANARDGRARRSHCTSQGSPSR